MRLTPTERQRLLVFNAAQFAREALSRGLCLSAPEATALITDEVQWAARAGLSYDAAAKVAETVLRWDQVLDGVPDLLDELRVDALFDEGSRLLVIRHPLGRSQTRPGEVRASVEPLPSRARRVRTQLEVTNRSTHVIRVSSHYPFHLVNSRLAFDREAARGFRLDLPAGEFRRWAPGERCAVTLVSTSGPEVEPGEDPS